MHKLIIYSLLSSFLILGCKDLKSPELITDPLALKYPEADFFALRNWPDESFDKSVYLRAVEQSKSKIASRSLTGTWETVGPGNISGRIASMAIDDAGVIYLGYSKGGVYKSEDDGQTYQPLIDGQAFLNISHIEIDPNDNNTIYLGTGDVDISIMFGIGNGVLKSTDGGETWENIGLEEESIISRVHVAPTNSQIVYASAMGIPGEKSNNRGVYKSVNGGGDWEQVLFVNDSTGIQDLLVDPTNPDIVYATGWNRFRSNRRSVVSGPDARIYRSRDGGDTWETLSNDLPDGNFARVGLAMSGTDPNTIFVNFGESGDLVSVHKSTDGGDSWELITNVADVPVLDNSHGGFAWFFGQMRVNPNNDDDIFLLGVRLFRSIDGGASWDNVTGNMHVDFHDLIFDGDRIYAGNDGGAYRSENLSNNWEDIDYNVTGLLYKVGYNPHLPDTYYGGAQDNGIYRGNPIDINGWERFSGGDGFQPAFHETNPEIIFTESQNGSIRMEHPLGTRFLTSDMEGRFYWDTPYFLSTLNPNQLFTGSDRVYRVDIEEASGEFEIEQLGDILTEPNSEWQAHSISTLDQSDFDPSFLFAGTTDGLVWRSLNGGQSWERIMNGLPRRFVSKIFASPALENTVYVTFTGYRDNEYIPHIFRSDDLGDTWIDISGDLPQFAINDVYVFPDGTDEHVFVATDGGAYYSANAGLTWNRLGVNMPLVPAWDFDHNIINNELIVGTFAKGILRYDLGQIGLGDAVSTQNLILEGLHVYPSPTSDLINISIDRATQFTYRLFDQSGRQLDQKQVSSNQMSLSLDQYPSGMYYLKVSSEGRQKTEKIIKL